MVGMKSVRGRTLFFALLCSATTMTAQSIKSPEVHPDGSITFRLMAPSAQKVEVQLDVASGTDTLTMNKDSTGLWTVTSKSLIPDVYSYRLSVDGVLIVDPNVHLFVPNLFEQGGLFTVPGSPAEPWEQTDIPHGRLHRHSYRSNIVGEQSEFYVYTPPKFDVSTKAGYPVLYLLHGYSDTADAWTVMGRANFILDSLIAQGKAKPMIVVMPLGYGAPQLLESGWNLEHNELWRKNIERFADVLLTEVIPQVEQDYPVQRDRNSRAIAGLSMGGAESLYIGLNHLDQFAWIGSMSAANFNNPADAFSRLDEQRAAKLKLLWIACGKEDDLIKSNRQFKAWLGSKNIKFESVETDGAHAWPVWRRNLIQLAPLLFR